MNLDTVKTELVQEFNKTDNPAFEKAIDSILNALDNFGYSIVPKTPEISSTDLFNLSTTINDWVTLPSEEGDELTISIDQIILSLQQAGWYILPPQ